MRQLSLFPEENKDPRSPVRLNWNLWHGCTKASAGGESGPNARPCDYAWVEDVQRQCLENGISFYYHQTGARLIKDGKLFHIPRHLQHSQAHKAGIDL